MKGMTASRKMPCEQQCEVCGMQATVELCDSRQTKPKNGYATHKSVGVHFFCKAHARDPRETPYNPASK